MTRVMTEGLEFPEGPVALEDGSVLVVDLLSAVCLSIFVPLQRRWIGVPFALTVISLRFRRPRAQY